MKKLLFAVFVGLLAASSLPAIAAPALVFGQVVDNLDVQKNTKLHVEEYWKSVKGLEVSWSGEIYDVEGSSSKAKILVADKSRPLYKGYNIVVETTDVPRAATLKRGQRIRFKGKLDDYSSKKPGAVIELKDGQLF